MVRRRSSGPGLKLCCSFQHLLQLAAHLSARSQMNEQGRKYAVARNAFAKPAPSRTCLIVSSIALP